jgi:tetratricopeptide (TPR) repeat protein
MAKQVHIKKLLRSEDAFMSTSDRAYNFFLTHTRQIILSAVGLVLVVAIFLIVIHVREINAQKAAEESQEALAIEDPGSSVMALSAIIEKYPGSPSAKVASLALAENLIANKSYPQAAENLEKFIAELGPGDEVMRVFTHITLGQVYEELNDLDKASRNYRTAQALVREEGTMEQMSLSLQSELGIAVGRVLKASGQTEQSRQAYNTVLLMNPQRNSVLDSLAKFSLAELGPPPSGQTNAAVTQAATPAGAENGSAVNAASAGTDGNVSAAAEGGNVTADNASNVTADNASNVTADNASVTISSAAQSANVTADNQTAAKPAANPRSNRNSRTNSRR